MKKSLFFLLLSFVVMMSSCSKKDAEKLLQTIPANSQYLALIDGESITDGLGPEGIKQIDQALGNAAQGNSGALGSAEYYLGDDSPIDLSVPLCVFELKRVTITTFAVRDADKFRTDVETKSGEKFRKEKDVWHLPNNTVFVDGDQVWITGSYPEIQASDINTLTKLPKSSSMASTSYTKDMIERDADVAVLVDIASILNANLGISAGLYLNMAFENPQYLVSYIDFQKGKIAGEMTVLNDKFKPAAFSLKPSPINIDALKNFPGRGNAFFAASFDSATIGRIIGQVKPLLPLPPNVIAAIENIDGNIAVSTNITSSPQQSEQLCAMVTFKDNASAETCASYLNGLAGSLPEGFTCAANGNTLVISTPNQSGQSIETVASNFKGAGMGLTVLTSGLDVGTTNVGSFISSFNACLVDNGSGSNLKITVNTTPGKNSLLSLIQFMNSLKVK